MCVCVWLGHLGLLLAERGALSFVNFEVSTCQVSLVVFFGFIPHWTLMLHFPHNLAGHLYNMPLISVSMRSRNFFFNMFSNTILGNMNCFVKL